MGPERGLDVDPGAAKAVTAWEEHLRRLVGRWPFCRGTCRIPAVLAKLMPTLNSAGAVGSVGAADVLFPYQPGDVAHPGFWFLYEKPVRRVLRRLLRPGSFFVDIGAHRGWHAGYALALVQPDGGVIACEPHPEHARSLRRLAALNPQKRLLVCEIALSDHVGEATLLASEHEGWHTLEPAFNEICSVPRTPISVAATTLDELLGEYLPLELQEDPPRMVVKVDAEGAELDILKGAKSTLELPCLRALIIECTVGTAYFRERAEGCIRILEGAGLVPYVLGWRGQRRWKAESLASQLDVLAVRPGHA